MAWAHVLPFLAAGARWSWRNRRELMWLHDRLRGRRYQRRRGGYRTGYMKGWSQGMRQNRNRQNFGYGRNYASRGRSGRSRRRRR